MKKSASRTESKTVGDKQEVKKGINPQIFDDEPAFVNFGLGATINTGNYESVKVDVRITIPCLPKDINKIYKFLADDVKKKMKVEIKNIRDAVKGRGL